MAEEQYGLDVAAAITTVWEQGREAGRREGYSEGVRAAIRALEELFTTARANHVVDPETQQEGATLSLDAPIEELDLMVRTYNCLYREGLRTIRQVVEMTADELLGMRWFGDGSLKDLKQKLGDAGYTLRGERRSG